ncbi:NPC intracellular cholesterol transporter 2-like [Macrobrachium nipponense]|uniref:NPC intracellular cholesterol transporter 2-like n=1 Tax=Macrobrachium nipponense TaxID=159736 RepID=UPI0030C7ED5D
MQRSLLILLGIAACAVATPFQDCGSKGTVVAFEVEGCSAPPCILQRGHSYLVTIQYTSSVDTDTLTLGASASIGGFEVPWPGVDTDACKQLEGTENPCPIEKGTAVDWQFPAEVLSEYPRIQTTATFKLIDSNRDYQFCAKVPAMIV